MLTGADHQTLDVDRRALKPTRERANDVVSDESHLDDLVAGPEKLAIGVFGPRIGRLLEIEPCDSRKIFAEQPADLRSEATHSCSSWLSWRSQSCITRDVGKRGWDLNLSRTPRREPPTALQAAALARPGRGQRFGADRCLRDGPDCRSCRCRCTTHRVYRPARM